MFIETQLRTATGNVVTTSEAGPLESGQVPTVSRLPSPASRLSPPVSRILSLVASSEQLTSVISHPKHSVLPTAHNLSAQTGTALFAGRTDKGPPLPCEFECELLQGCLRAKKGQKGPKRAKAGGATAVPHLPVAVKPRVLLLLLLLLLLGPARRRRTCFRARKALF